MTETTTTQSNGTAPSAPAAPGVPRYATHEDTDSADLADLRAAFGGDAPKAAKDDSGGESSPAPSPQGHEETPPEADAAPKEPAEPKPDEKKDGGKLFAAALKEREKSRAEISRAEQLVREAEARNQALEARESALAAREAKWKAVDDDPMAFFEVSGKSPHDFARWLMANPEDQQRMLAEKKRAEPPPEVLELRKEVEALKEQRKAEAERVSAAVQASKQRDFETFVEQNAAKYPDFALEDNIGQRMWEIAAQHFAATKEIATPERIAEHLQAEAAERSAKKEQRRLALLGARNGTPLQLSASHSSQTRQPTPGHPASPEPRNVTLTNGAAAERASAPRELTREEADKRDLEELATIFG